MAQQKLEEAVALGARVGHIFVATADDRGVPHLAAAGKITTNRAGRVTVGAWFCPGTIENLRVNPRVSLVAWDREADRGFQLAGEVEQILDEAVLDGYMPGKDESAVPQVERELVVRVTHVIPFTHAPHTDREE